MTSLMIYTSSSIIINTLSFLNILPSLFSPSTISTPISTISTSLNHSSIILLNIHSTHPLILTPIFLFTISLILSCLSFMTTLNSSSPISTITTSLPILTPLFNINTPDPSANANYQPNSSLLNITSLSFAPIIHPFITLFHYLKPSATSI